MNLDGSLGHGAAPSGIQSQSVIWGVILVLHGLGFEPVGMNWGVSVDRCGLPLTGVVWD